MHRWIPTLILLATILAGTAAAEAPAWIWDVDRNGIDDRIEDVEANGIAVAHRNGDLGDRLLFDVSQIGLDFVYGIYVKYDHLPTEADETALTAQGLATHRYRYIPYIRSKGTFAQIQAALALAEVVRIESIPVFYPVNDNGTQTMQAAGSGFEMFPSAHEDLGITGKGVVVAILDTGVQDEPHGLNPGHESLTGKFLGGGTFWSGDPALNTPLNGSENPPDGSPDFSHGSHVAGTAIGTGGPTGLSPDPGFYRGVAPDARLVDCKVLSDAGTGLGSADGLEWCIFHKDDDWDLTGADTVYSGIQVVNMSLGGSSASDGTDANSAAVNAAVKAGLIVCIATGNDGNTGYMPSPAAADNGVAVGASVDANTLARADDIVADFSNEGPRTADGDTDVFDEMKPSVCAPGAGITSVEGVLTADGTTYTTTNGTSMAAPMTAGVCALIAQACPGISPEKVRRILQDTADHRVTGGQQPPGAADPFGVDPNYHPSWGWGNVNAYAAVLEARFPNRTQIVRMWGEATTGGNDIHFVTQREVDTPGFNVFRADPVYGQPGAFVQINPALIPAVGDPVIHADDNRQDYVFQDTDPALVPGETYWYRVQWVDIFGTRHDEPAFPVVFEPPTPIATIHYSVTHNTPDNDLLMFIGSGADASDPVNTAGYFFAAPGAGAADSSVSVAGEATTGNIRHYWTLTLTDQDFGAGQHLPPSPDNPWFFFVNEAGFINRTGRIEDFSITYDDPGGDVVHTPLLPFPVLLVETQTSTVWIPSDPDLNPSGSAPVLDPIGPKEVQEGKSISFTISATDPDGDPVTYSASNVPAGAAFDPGTRTFSWSPGFDAVASTTAFPVTFEAADAGGSDTEEVEIRLHDVDPGENLPPNFTAVNDQSVIEGNTLEFKVAARDPECGAMVYSASGLPAGASFDPNTQIFSWATADGDAGEYEIDFTADDGVNPPATERVIITVKGAVPPLTAPCESEISQYLGNSDTGAADIGTADLDTVTVSLASGAVRLFAVLSWTTPADLDYVLYDASFNAVGGGASLGNPETILADNLSPGVYHFVVEGFTVAVPTDWTLEVEACVVAPVSVVLSHFAAHGGEGTLRLEWATSTEDNHAGFRVYRSAHETTGFVRIDGGLVSGDGVYEFVDTDPLAVEGGTAYYKLGAVDRDGREEMLGPWLVDLASVRPLAFRLAQNFPNPYPLAAGGTTVRFTLPGAAKATLDVFDIRGRRVRNLASGTFAKGATEIVWDGTDSTGRRLSSGIYFYRLEVPGAYVETRRMVLTP